MQATKEKARFLRLRERRLQKRLTIFRLAQIVGVSPLTVRMWEQGVAEPTPESKRILCRALGRSWSWLAAEVR